LTKLAAPKHVSNAQLIAALRKNAAIISSTAKSLGLSRQNVNQRIRSSRLLQSEVRDIQDSLLDTAEGHVVRQICGGDPQTTKWYLERKGADRGYSLSRPPAVGLQIHEIEAIVRSLGGDLEKLRAFRDLLK
jgi:hypothetical protein